MATQEDQELIGEHIASHEGIISPYVLESFIAGGAFGKVYQGVNENTRQKVAIKLERGDAQHRQLYLEFGFYMRLGRDCTYAPRIHYFGSVGQWNALVMDMLGPSLLKLMKTVGHYSNRCTAAMGICFLRIFADFHAKGLIFRDIKPENFLVGRPDTENAHSLYLIDLGLAKEWRTEEGHIPYSEGNKPVTGTPLYMSVHMHQLAELSRRDDLEAILYMLIFLHDSTLPWQEADREGGTPTERMRRYGEYKMNLTADEICVNMPKRFKSVFKRVRKLKFEEDPDYECYTKKFTSILADQGINIDELDSAFDWDALHRKRPNCHRGHSKESRKSKDQASRHRSRSKRRRKKKKSSKRNK